MGLCVAFGLGFVRFSTGTAGQGGTECGSVWMVSAYYAGCVDRLALVADVVFVGIGVSVGLLGVGLAGHRQWVRAVALVSGAAIALLGASMWTNVVFETFGY